MTTLILSMPGNEEVGRSLASGLAAEFGSLHLRQFPDGESYIRLECPVAGRDVVLLSTLVQPDAKTLPLLFAADAARDLGARRVFLAAPYLGYLRQDRRFRDGEAVTSVTFAKLLSGHFDGLVTVDPHLHRYRSLSEVYSIPSRVVHSSGMLAGWLRKHVGNALVIGPDSESEQWVSEVARAAGVPFVVLEKTRMGDREVEIRVPSLGGFVGRDPVIIDDIVSTARTMAKAVGLIADKMGKAPLCLGVHAIFAGDAYEVLTRAGAVRIVTCNTIPHPSNAIDIVPLLAESVRELLSPPAPA